MKDEKLVLRHKKYIGESGVVSFRLPKSLISELDELARQSRRTRNDVAQKCLEFAVENLEIR